MESPKNNLIQHTNNPQPKRTPRYSPDAIHTGNLASFRGSDLYFDPELEPSMTHQSFASECDINNIINQYEVTGFLNHTNPLPPMQGDFSEYGPGTDFLSAQNYLVEAQASFDALPAKIRARFQNNPAELLNFLEDPENRSDAIKLGLLNPEAESPPAVLPEASKPKKSAPAPQPEPDA